MPDGGHLMIETANADLPDLSDEVVMKPGHYICLTVTDTGTGMDAATMEEVFEPFHHQAD